MRVFFAGIGPIRSDGRPGLWTLSLRDPLLRMGHQVVETALDCDQPMLHLGDEAWAASGRAVHSQRLLEEVRREHRKQPLDLFVSYFYSVHAEPEAIRQIRKLGIVTVNFYCDAAHSFHRVSEIAPAYDACWVPEREALPLYIRAGARPVHIQMGANTQFFTPIPSAKRDISVLFAGSIYADRPMLLAKLLKRGVPLQVYRAAAANPYAGEGSPSCPARRSAFREAWVHLRKHGPASLARRAIRMLPTKIALRRLRPVTQPAVVLEELPRLYARSEVVLNLSHQYDAGEPGGKLTAHVKLRDFEVPACRALYFPQYCDELSRYYDLRKEVVAWSSIEQLVDKVRYYLSRPGEAEEVREAGYRRALNEHTWEHRYGQLFGALGIQ